MLLSRCPRYCQRLAARVRVQQPIVSHGGGLYLLASATYILLDFIKMPILTGSWISPSERKIGGQEREDANNIFWEEVFMGNI